MLHCCCFVWFDDDHDYCCLLDAVMIITWQWWILLLLSVLIAWTYCAKPWCCHAKTMLQFWNMLLLLFVLFDMMIDDMMLTMLLKPAAVKTLWTCLENSHEPCWMLLICLLLPRPCCYVFVLKTCHDAAWKKCCYAINHIANWWRIYEIPCLLSMLWCADWDA